MNDSKLEFKSLLFDIGFLEWVVVLVRESVADAEEAAASRAMGLDCTIVSHTTSQCEIAKSILPIALLQNLHGEAGCDYVSSED